MKGRRRARTKNPEPLSDVRTVPTAVAVGTVRCISGKVPVPSVELKVVL